MKTHLLLALSVGICINATAQNNSIAVQENTVGLQNNTIDNDVIGFHPLAPAKPLTFSDRAITRKKIGSSYNVLTLIVEQSNCLTANQATNLVMFTHRINSTWAATGVNSGFIQSTYSSDNDITWDSLLQTQEAAPNLCRYPSGTIFNPSGNTTPGNAFGVATGPITNGGTSNAWAGNFFASTQMNKANNNVKIRLNATPGVGQQFFPRISIQSTDNKVIVSGALYGGDPGAAGATAASNKYRGATINIGTLSGTAFNWTLDSIKPSFKTHPVGLNNEVNTSVLTAWSKDGNTGYMVFFGIDAAATGSMLSYQPIVYKTVTGGTLWVKLPAHDYSAIPSINAKLRASNTTTGPNGPKKAFYSATYGNDAVVDANGNLHIISGVSSGFSTHPDSLSYAFNTSPYLTNYLFDTYTTTTGGWGATFIDSLKCTSATTNSPFANTAGTKTAVSARLQASMSTDATHIFYMWGDSDPTLQPIENIQPDIYGKGYNVTTGKYTPTKMFTSTSDNYFMYISNVALVSGTTYKIPATISYSQDGSGNTDLPFDHYYVSGIEFTESEFVGVNEITKNGNLTISQNYPNPFSKSTSLDVTLTQASDVTIEVYNAIGQKVITQNSAKLSTGTHTLTIDGSKLHSGVYFYTVKAADASVTSKMIIQ